jgi:3-oxoacyl-[acyl-carrier protein] reductase
VIYGGGGAIGGAVAQAMAREGASVFLTGRSRPPLEEVAGKIRADGGTVHVAEVDALDEAAIERHADRMLETAGRVDISFNAVGNDHFQGIPLVDLPREKFSLPLADRLTTQFLTARAAARRMVANRSGVILMITATPARLPISLCGSFGAACAAVEGLARSFAAELGPAGVRVICLRSAGSPDAPGVRMAFEDQASGRGISREQVQAAVENTTLLQHLPTLAEVAHVAAFVASDRAGGMTGTVVNLTAGASAD